MSAHPATLLLAPTVALLAMLMCAARRYSTRVRLYAAQSATVVIASSALRDLALPLPFLVFATLTLVVKCGLLPRLLAGLRRRHPHRREPARGWSALIVAGAILAAAQGATAHALPGADGGAAAAAIATVLLGAYICSRSAEPLAQLLGLLVAENGVALAVVTLGPGDWLGFAVLLGFQLGLVAVVLALRNPVFGAALLADPTARIGGRP